MLCGVRAAVDAKVQARSDVAKSDEQWFAQLRLEVERVTRAHMQVSGWLELNVTRHASHVTRHTSHVTRHTSHAPQEMDQCERRLQDARTARDGDRAEQAAAMAAANARTAELQKTLQQLQVSVGRCVRACACDDVHSCVQEQQRQAERAHDNCRRDLEEQAASNEELSEEMQARVM